MMGYTDYEYIQPHTHTQPLIFQLHALSAFHSDPCHADDGSIKPLITTYVVYIHVESRISLFLSPSLENGKGNASTRANTHPF